MHDLWIHRVAQNLQAGEVHILSIILFAFYSHGLKMIKNIYNCFDLWCNL